MCIQLKFQILLLSTSKVQAFFFFLFFFLYHAIQKGNQEAGQNQAHIGCANPIIVLGGVREGEGGVEWGEVTAASDKIIIACNTVPYYTFTALAPTQISTAPLKYL